MTVLIRLDDKMKESEAITIRRGRWQCRRRRWSDDYTWQCFDGKTMVYSIRITCCLLLMQMRKTGMGTSNRMRKFTNTMLSTWLSRGVWTRVGGGRVGVLKKWSRVGCNARGAIFHQVKVWSCFFGGVFCVFARFLWRRRCNAVCDFCTPRFPFISAAPT